MYKQGYMNLLPLIVFYWGLVSRQRVKCRKPLFLFALNVTSRFLKEELNSHADFIVKLLI